ncbi:hypothetical protein [Butyrivibrio sp. MC2021]|uniref:hypothetical protein n=1 Tax=Butyrivibrio sp. MC2021 TaxID=1408306 RepID=UPI000479F39D|nr:hypothetical protein [Butyrivibrio sp. MC2021]
MRLFVGFKGKNNASSVLVEELPSEHLLLTNSFTGLIMYGADEKRLYMAALTIEKMLINYHIGSEEQEKKSL